MPLTRTTTMPMKTRIAHLKKNTADFAVDYALLKFGEILGKGSQGEVYRAMWRGLEVAVKKIDVRNVDPDIVDDFCSEANMLKLLRHPALTLFLGVAITPPNLCILTEIVERGSLFDLLHNEMAALTWSRCMRVAYDICQGMIYLHEHDPPIIHRDLKSLNILVTESWGGKVADFGMTRFHDNGIMTQCGSPLWMSPQMAAGLPYDTKCDVYSFGIILWEMYCRKIPYRDLGLNTSQLIVKICKENLRPPIPKHCPRAYAKLMERCWHPLPEKRPTFKQCMSVINSFLNDAAMMSHQPQSSRNNTVKIEEESPSEVVLQLWDTNAWRIRREDIEIVSVDSSDAGSMRAERLRSSNFSTTTDDTANSKESRNASGAFVLKPTMIRLQSQNNSPRLVSDNMQSPKHRTRIYQLESAEKEHDFERRRVDASRSLSVQSTAINLAVSASPNAHSVHKSKRTDMFCGKLKGKPVSIRTCIVDMSLISVESGERVQADLAGERMESPLWQAIRNSANLRHPNIVLFFGAYVDIDHVGIVTEVMERGVLSDIINDESLLLDWDTSLQLLIDVASAMAYLHGCDPPVVHPSLTVDSLFLDKNWRVKVANAGFIDLQRLIKNVREPDTVFTAPELLMNQQQHVTLASNVYSFGFVLWFVLARSKIFDGQTMNENLKSSIINDQLRPQWPSLCSPELRELGNLCWSPLPHIRPTFQYIIEQLISIKSTGPPKYFLIEGTNASRYVKAKTVYAFRSKDPFVVLKDWGISDGKAGSFILFSELDDVYAVNDAKFSETYQLVNEGTHEYRKIGSVLARRMECAFAVKTSGGIEHGLAGDYLVQNDQLDQWSIEARSFHNLYTLAEGCH